MAPLASTAFDTSFLPQQPAGRPDPTGHRKEPISVSMIIALVLFFMMLFATGGVVLIKKNIERRISSEKAELAKMEAMIDMGKIAKFERITSRVSAAEKLLANHVAFSLALDILSAGTAVNVGYSSLGFSAGEGGAPQITLSGVAPSYAAVYFQGQAIKTRPYIKNAQIGSVALDSRTGTVTFTMTVALSPDALEYGRYFKSPGGSRSGNVSESTPPGPDTTKASGQAST